MPRFSPLALPLATLVAVACSSCATVQSPQTAADGPLAIASADPVSTGPAVADPPATPSEQAAFVLARADVVADVVDGPADDGSLIAVAVAEPAPLEDPVQFQAARAPVRMELAQTRRRVVLLPGVGAREPAPDPGLSVGTPEGSALSSLDAQVAYARAVVVVSEGGRREVRYVDVRASPLDLGADVGCGAGALETGLRLRGVRATALRLGMRGDAVRAAQHLLCAAGYDVGTDGVFGQDVDRAVRQFQRDHNASGRGRRLSVDGALGHQTRQALEAAVAARGGR